MEKKRVYVTPKTLARIKMLAAAKHQTQEAYINTLIADVFETARKKDSRFHQAVEREEEFPWLNG